MRKEAYLDRLFSINASDFEAHHFIIKISDLFNISIICVFFALKFSFYLVLIVVGSKNYFLYNKVSFVNVWQMAHGNFQTDNSR